MIIGSCVISKIHRNEESIRKPDLCSNYVVIKFIMQIYNGKKACIIKTLLLVMTILILYTSNRCLNIRFYFAKALKKTARIFPFVSVQLARVISNFDITT